MIAHTSKAKPIKTTIGANVILLKLKIFSLNTAGSSDPPPSMRIKPNTIIPKPIASIL